MALAMTQWQSQLQRLGTGRAAALPKVECSANRSLLPFQWQQRKGSTPEALYIVQVCSKSCHERVNKRYLCPVPCAPKAMIRLHGITMTST